VDGSVCHCTWLFTCVTIESRLSAQHVECLVEENVRVGQVSNVGCGNERGPMVANDRKI